MDLTCPLDGTHLISDYSDESFSYECSKGHLYVIKQCPKIGEFEEIKKQAILKLNKYRKRLNELKYEESTIKEIFEYAEKSGLIKRIGLVNLSEQRSFNFHTPSLGELAQEINQTAKDKHNNKGNLSETFGIGYSVDKSKATKTTDIKKRDYPLRETNFTKNSRLNY